MSQMIFTHDTELTLRAACVLINSDRVDGERLGDQAALDTYLDGFGWTGRRDHDNAELKSVTAAARAAGRASGRPPTTRKAPSRRSTRC